MKSLLVRVPAGVVSLVGVAALVTACSSSSSKSPTASAPAPASAAASMSMPASTGDTVSLTIDNFAYDPTPITAKPGETVTIMNMDSVGHTVTSDTAGVFGGSTNIAKGTPVSFTAPMTPGTYTYHCNYHSKMHGTLVVTSS